jgi:hypothetical protein
VVWKLEMIIFMIRVAKSREYSIQRSKVYVQFEVLTIIGLPTLSGCIEVYLGCPSSWGEVSRA